MVKQPPLKAYQDYDPAIFGYVFSYPVMIAPVYQYAGLYRRRCAIFSMTDDDAEVFISMACGHYAVARFCMGIREKDYDFG